MWVLINHELLEDQKKDARLSYGIEEFLYPPEKLQQYWAQVPAEGVLPVEELRRITTWLSEEAEEGDLVLVQGDFGAAFYIVDFCLVNGLVPVYATSVREYSGYTDSDGSVVRKHTFRHIALRKYRRWSGDYE